MSTKKKLMQMGIRCEDSPLRLVWSCFLITALFVHPAREKRKTCVGLIHLQKTIIYMAMNDRISIRVSVSQVLKRHITGTKRARSLQIEEKAKVTKVSRHHSLTQV